MFLHNSSSLDWIGRDEVVVSNIDLYDNTFPDTYLEGVVEAPYGYSYTHSETFIAYTVTVESFEQMSMVFWLNTGNSEDSDVILYGFPQDISNQVFIEVELNNTEFNSTVS